MINGTHVIIYTRDAATDRAFIRDTLGFPLYQPRHPVTYNLSG